MDIDAFNTSLVGRLASIVMLPDTPVKRGLAGGVLPLGRQRI